MTMANNLFAQNQYHHTYHHAYGPSTCAAPMAIVEEDKECSSSKGQVPSSSLASRDSVDSILSWASSASSTTTTDSDSILSSQGTGASGSASRRRIFSTYWQKNPTNGNEDQQEDDDDEDEDDQPRSPLVEHYPSKTNKSLVVQEPSVSVSPTSTLPQPAEAFQEKSLQEPPQPPPPPLRRRSIFGAAAARHRARSSSYNGSASTSSNTTSLDRFFSKHEHMTVLSASTLEPIDAKDYETNTTNTGMASLRLRRTQRARSYSCSDASVESAASSTTSNHSKKVPLPSCLKRRNSYTNHHTHNSDNDLEASWNASCSTLTALNENEELQDDGDADTPASPVRRPSVTFDSQIEILAFEPLKSYEVESTWGDGSWTDLFGR